MPDLQLTFDVGSADPAPIEETLTSLGATSVTLEDAADDPVLEPAPGETPLWPTVRLRALFREDADPRAIQAGLVELLPPTTLLRFEVLEDRPWEREWLRDFHPMRFGRRLWVCPDGQAAGDANAVRVALDPGLAFGTGTHPTTALCLEWLDGSELRGCRVIDYGCGSGILAIAALKLGAAEAFAYDIDPHTQRLRRGLPRLRRIVAITTHGSSKLVNAFTLGPNRIPIDSMNVTMSLFGKFFVPLNAMCSMKCASPSVFSDSRMDPAFTIRWNCARFSGFLLARM